MRVKKFDNKANKKKVFILCCTLWEIKRPKDELEIESGR